MPLFFQPHIDFLALPSPRLHPAFHNLRLLHLSDLHLTTWNKRLDAWQKALASLPAPPDLLVITGDLGHRSWLWKRSFDTVARFLEPLAPPLGTYFILGNHDSVKLGPALADTTDALGKPRILLQNETVFLHKAENTIHVQLPPRLAPTPASSAPNAPGMFPKVPKSAPNTSQSAPNAPATPPAEDTPRLALIGIHQHRRIDTDIPSALRPVRPNDFKLMLLHYPDLVHPAVAAGADVCLAGHTHGGQICWPDGSPLFGQDSLTPAQCTGVHKVNGTWMVVNRGIGAAGVRMRLFCPAHAILITLQAQTAAAAS